MFDNSSNRYRRSTQRIRQPQPAPAAARLRQRRPRGHRVEGQTRAYAPGAPADSAAVAHLEHAQRAGGARHSARDLQDTVGAANGAHEHRERATTAAVAVVAAAAAKVARRSVRQPLGDRFAPICSSIPAPLSPSHFMFAFVLRAHARFVCDLLVFAHVYCFFF